MWENKKIDLEKGEDSRPYATPPKKPTLVRPLERPIGRFGFGPPAQKHREKEEGEKKEKKRKKSEKNGRFGGSKRWKKWKKKWKKWKNLPTVALGVPKNEKN